MPIHAVLFDLDGTLLDQEGAERTALERLFLNDVKIDPAPVFSAFLRLWRNTADEWLAEFLKGRLGFDEQRLRRMMAVHSHFGTEISREKAAELTFKYVDYYKQEWALFSDAVPTLEALKKKLRLGVVTNGDGGQQRAKLTHTGLLPFFESITISGEAGVAKPARGIFDKAREAFGLKADSLAYVGDRLETDAIGARDAGWQAILLDRKGMPGTQEKGVKVITGLSELTSIL